MNHIHRVVWNEHTGAWVAVSETARSRGKGSGRSARKALLAALIACGGASGLALAEQAATTVIPASGKTNAYISANGVPVVNIETANASGLSHNRYNRYDVELNGLVLNNGNNSLIARQSQLAGQVVSNLNLVQEARVILNEVVSTSRSTLAGFTEVLGGKADVIVANPNGITCNGCGFINTDRATLTTGTSNTTSEGSLTGFSVNRGDILIQGLGASASTQQIFDLVARSVTIDGKINTSANGSLGITAGNNTWRYSDREVSATATGSTAPPALAIDSTALGGMYAGRIRMISTEAGVGVRMLGEAAASADDFTLSSAGRIEIQSSVSAQRDLQISTTSASGNGDLALTGSNASLSGQRNVALDAQVGQIKLTEGQIYAANNLTLTGAALSDTSASGLTRFAASNTTLTTTGLASIDGAIWGAGAALSGTFGSLSIGAQAATLYAGSTLTLSSSGNMALANAAIRATGDMALSAATGQLSATGGAGQGIQSTTGNLSLSAGNGLDNAGTMTSDTGQLTARVNGTLQNSGTLHAATSLDIADQLGGSSQNVVNSGTLLADQQALIKANNISNESGGTLQGSTGTVLSATSLNNAGTITGSATPGYSAEFTLGSLTNSGTLQSTQDLQLHLSNSLTNTGKVLASRDLSVNAGTSALAISNSAPGILQAGRALTISAAQGTFNTQSGAVLGDTTTLTLASLNNSGTLQSDSAMALTITNDLSNSGTMLAKSTLSSSSANLSNTGTLQASQGSMLTTGNLTNSGRLIASDSSNAGATLNVSTLSNTASGVIQSAQNLNLNIAGGALTNSASIMAARDLTITSTGSALLLRNQSGGFLQAGLNAGDTLTLGGAAVAVETQAGSVMLADQLSFNLASLGNAGTIQGGTAASTITTSGALENASGGMLTLATGGSATGTLNANSLSNSGTLQSSAAIQWSVTGLLSNSGTLLSASQLNGTSGTLNNAGTLQAGQGATLQTSTLTNSGTIIASGSGSHGATLNVTTLDNSGTGVIQSAQNLSVNLTGSTLSNAGTLIAANDLALTSTGSGLDVTNQAGGFIQAGQLSGDTLSIGGTNVTLSNVATGNILGDQLLLNLSSLNNAGTLQGGSAASVITTSGTLANSGTLRLTSSSAGSATVNADTVTNSGTLQSQGNATFNTGTSFTNSHQLLAGAALTLRGLDSSYSLTNSARMQSGGVMDIKGQSAGNGVDITIGNSGVMLGDSVLINASNLTLNNGGMLSSSGALTLTANNLSFGGSTSRIVAATGGSTTASITLANGFSNPGAVHSGGHLTFSAPTITNTSTGGFSALGNLTLSATSGALSNYGALYAGQQLTASSTSTLTNQADTGTIDADLDITLNATEFRNYFNVTAGRHITVNAATFRNEVVGGDTRVWSGIAWGGDTNTSTDDWYDFPDDYRTEYWQRTGVKTQSFSGGAPSYKPQMIAANTLSILGFDNGYNTGGVLSGQTVNLVGNGGSASFINNDLALHNQNWKQTWERYTHWIALGPAKYDDRVYRNDSGAYMTNQYQTSSIGAGIFATTLNAGGFSLVNAGSAKSASASALSQSGSSNTALSGTSSGTSGSAGSALTGAVSGGSSSSGVTGITAANGSPAISFGGLVINLPTNPNGYFVLSQSAGSQFLVETNPLFAVGSNYVGTDYMAQRYGYNPDTVIKRLGDSNYEAYLIRQQLINQTGTNLLQGYGSEVDQMKRLMDQALSQGRSAGFVFGKALDPSQVANLKEDVVWMVETVVAGQKVLAPVVYLASGTRNAIERGAVIAADDMTMNLTSLTNTGGTISGAKSLSVTSQGDITNTSGTLKGGAVSLVSTQGSIVNKTETEGDGSKEDYNTVIGKTAGIIATGDLTLKAKEDIKVIGANVSAGGNASLDAGKNITFDTIVDKSTNTTRSSSNAGPFNSSRETTTTTTETNIGSKLTVGANLSLKSGGDTTIAGSEVSTVGDLNVDTGGSLNVIARQDKTTVKSEKTTSGLGVGGGLAGTEKVTTDSFTGTNAGSTLTAGGNATIKSDKSVTLQGSDLTIGGNADINAKTGINVLDGLDETRTTTRTETTTFLKMDNGSETKSDSGAKSGTASGPGRASATASADASAEASGTSDLKLAETTTTTTQAGSNTSVASNLKVGGNLKLSTGGTLKVQGSNVESGGDMALDAKNVEVLTGRNEEWSNTQTTRTSVGIYNEGNANAQAGAQAQAKAGTMGTDASASANASAEASGTTTIGARTENENSTAYKLTNSSSTLKSGGNLTIDAKNDATFVGANVESAGDLSIKATNITNRAAQDIEINTSSKTSHLAGLYVDGKVSAEASAKADAGKINLGGAPASAEASASASADASAGVRYKTTQESSTDGSVTQVTSSFKSGGNLTRNAKNTILDQGTQIEAGGNITQTAREIKEIEANNTTFSSSSASSHDAKIGVGAGASAGAKADSSGEAEADAGAGAGFRAKYAGSIEGESESSSTAVTTRYKSGGNINSTSTEKTTLIGTQFESGGDINLNAGSLEFKAAKDTTTSSSSSQEINAELKVDVVGKAGGSLTADYANEGAAEKSSTARVGSLNAGGNLNIKTKGDASFEGTQLEAGDKATIAAGGTVDFKAARDTTESRETAIDASLELSSSKGSKGAEASAGYSQTDSASSQAQTSSIKAGSGGISISAGQDANFEGTALNSSGDTAIEAGRSVNLKAAKNTETSTSFGVEAGIGAESGDEGSKKSGSLGASASYANKVDSDVTSINSGGKVSIKGANVVNQEATVQAAEGSTVVGKQTTLKAEKSDIAVGIEVSASGESETKKTAPKSGSKTTDDIPDKKADTSTTQAPRAKTTDDLPAKSTDKKPVESKSATDKAAERKATLDQLKADKKKLDEALLKKKKPASTEEAAKPEAMPNSSSKNQ